MTRKKDEIITLVLPDGREISIKVIATGRERSKLGVVAPGDVQILREELRGTLTSLSDNPATGTTKGD